VPVQGGGYVSTRRIELEIGRGDGPDSFVVKVLHSSGGRPQARLELDVGHILSRRHELENTVLASTLRVRRAVAPDEKALREVGQQLFEALFSGPVDGAYRASLGAARPEQERLQVALHITAPELAALPWETMFDPVIGKYLCLDEPLVRHVDAPFAPEPLDVRPPVRILGLVAAPKGLPSLDVQAEQENLNKALAGAVAEGLVQLTWAPDASWRTIHGLLLGQAWNILHFVGHGDFDPAGGEGRLALVGPNEGPDFVQASRLADLLSEADPTPRLVVLNSCAAGQSGADDLFSGTAAALVHGGVSAVAAMQFSVSDDAAIAFARGFYTAIAHGRQIDMAARSGRIEILGLNTLEWVTPVLYARGGVGELFRLQGPPTEGIRGIYAKAEAQLQAKNDEAAIGLLKKLLARSPENSEEERLLGQARRILWLTETYVSAQRAEKSGALDSAISEYSRIVQADSSYRDAQTRLAACQSRLAANRPPAVRMPDSPAQVRLTRIHAPGTDVTAVANALYRWYESQGLEVIAATTTEGLTLQCRTHDAWSRRLGMGVALTVTLRGEGDSLLVEIGAAKWLGKGTGTAFGVGLATHGVGWVTIGVGAWKQHQLPKQTLAFLRTAAIAHRRATN
jgi:hypothetical protein